MIATLMAKLMSMMNIFIYKYVIVRRHKEYIYICGCMCVYVLMKNLSVQIKEMKEGCFGKHLFTSERDVGFFG